MGHAPDVYRAPNDLADTDDDPLLTFTSLYRWFYQLFFLFLVVFLACMSQPHRESVQSVTKAAGMSVRSE